MTGPESETIHRELETDQEDPAVEIAEIVAEIEEKDHTELPPVYDCIDHSIDNIFSNPPAQEAQIEVRFSYEGYRITVEQDGEAKLVKTGGSSTSG